MITYVNDLIQAHGIVQGQAQTNRMCRGQFDFSDLKCLLVEIFGLFTLLRIFKRLCEVAVVVSCHLEVEHRTLIRLRH